MKFKDKELSTEELAQHKIEQVENACALATGYLAGATSPDAIDTFAGVMADIFNELELEPAAGAMVTNLLDMLAMACHGLAHAAIDDPMMDEFGPDDHCSDLTPLICETLVDTMHELKQEAINGHD